MSFDDNTFFSSSAGGGLYFESPEVYAFQSLFSGGDVRMKTGSFISEGSSFFSSSIGRVEIGAITTLDFLGSSVDAAAASLHANTDLAIDDSDMMNEAVEEHHLVHVLITELKKLKPKDEKFHAKFTVLSELVKHHIEEEEGEMLREAERHDIDWDALEVAVMKRKEALMAKSSKKSGMKSKTSAKSSRRG